MTTATKTRTGRAPASQTDTALYRLEAVKQTGGKSVEVPVVFGETLVERLEGGSERIGGASFNVAWHLQAFGESPMLITRVGDDEDSERIFERMCRWGLDTSGVQVDRRLPTGVIDMMSVGTLNPLNIPNDQAWDAIEPDPVAELFEHRRTTLVVHGSLARAR